MIKVFYTGNNISLNQYYKSHWTLKQKKKEEIINSLIIIDEIPVKNQYKVAIKYNGRSDVDNVIPLVKVILDWLRRTNLIIDDNPAYFKSLSITHDDSLAKNFYSMEVINL